MQSFLMKLSFVEPGGFISQLDEFAVLFSAMLLILFYKNFVSLNIQLRKPLLYFSSYFFIALISSLFGVVVLQQFLLQFSLDLKPFIVIMVSLVFFDQVSLERFERLIKVVLLINIPFVAWQIFFSESYDSIFANGSHFGIVYTSDGNEYSRAAGAFWFTGIYALFSALSTGYFLSKLVIDRKLSVEDRFYLFVSIILLLLSLSRGEIVACIVSSILMYFVHSRQRYIKNISFIVVLLLFIVVLIFSSVILERWLIEIGFISSSIDLAPRAIFMQAAIDISKDYFPLGAGLGSFGGKAAVDYDSIFFYKYLISHEWYFKYGFFLTDTFWPKIIAETGLLGSIFYLVGLFYFLHMCTIKSNLYSAYSFFAIVFIIINSLSSPVLNDSFSIAFVFILFNGVFVAKSKST